MTAADVRAALSRVAVLPVPGVAGAYVREISVATWDAVVRPALERGGTDAGIALVIAAACDENGERLFDVGSEDDVKLLPVRVVNAIATAASNANTGEGDESGNS